MRTAILVVLLSLPLLAQLPDGASTEIRVQEVKGEVEYQAAPKTAWKVPQAGDLLPVGTKLCTGIGGAVVLAFGTNSVAMLREASVMMINAYGMQGDELVAQVKIDPGVCSVSVKQLAQFQTDFQVSTPRLTASVRGSGYTITAHALEELLADYVTVTEHMALILQAWGGARYVSAGGSANSKNQGPDQIALLNAIVEVLGGLAENEQDPVLLSVVDQTIANLGADQNGLGANQFLQNQELLHEVEQPDGGQVQFTNATAQLTWGATPTDLDLHVKTKYQDGTMFEVFFGNQDSPDGLVHLDRDDTSGFGPETITVDQFREGTYTYFVDNFSESPPIGTSNAVLTVQEQGGGNRIFNVNPTAVEDFWHVFDFNVNAGGTATVIPVDTYSNTAPPFPGEGN